MISLRDCMQCVADTKCRAMRRGGRIVLTVTTGNLTGSFCIARHPYPKRRLPEELLMPNVDYFRMARQPEASIHSPQSMSALAITRLPT